jgi:hypothetical protein
MSFPTTEVINTWFQDAHTTALKAGGSVYVMEKRAEHEVVNSVLRWACLTMLDELEDLNYPTSSRVCIRVGEMLTALYGIKPSTEDDELVDDYIDDIEDEDENTTKEKSVINLNTCKVGQKLRLRNGNIVTYDGNTDNDYGYPHTAHGFIYTNNGNYHDDGEQSKYDIVEILSMEDQDTNEETSIEIDEDLLREVTTALLKALITSK